MLNCQNCPNPCFDFEETGICKREAELPPAVCPMFEDIPLDECPGIDYHSVGITVRAIPP